MKFYCFIGWFFLVLISGCDSKKAEISEDQEVATKAYVNKQVKENREEVEQGLRKWKDVTLPVALDAKFEIELKPIELKVDANKQGLDDMRRLYDEFKKTQPTHPTAPSDPSTAPGSSSTSAKASVSIPVASVPTKEDRIAEQAEAIRIVEREKAEAIKREEEDKNKIQKAVIPLLNGLRDEIRQEKERQISESAQDRAALAEYVKDLYKRSEGKVAFKPPEQTPPPDWIRKDVSQRLTWRREGGHRYYYVWPMPNYGVIHYLPCFP